MEYVFNWLVLLLSMGAIVLVALVCCADLKKGGVRHVESAAAAAPVVEAGGENIVQPKAASGPFVELIYRRGDEVEYVQKVYDGQKGYIGTESYPNLGAGMPIRYIEVAGRGGEFTVSNLDWQMPAQFCDDGEEAELQIGQEAIVSDGSQIRLSGGWTVECRISEGAEE